MIDRSISSAIALEPRCWIVLASAALVFVWLSYPRSDAETYKAGTAAVAPGQRDAREVAEGMGPRVVVTESEVTYQGQLLATTCCTQPDDGPRPKLDALYDRLEASLSKIRGRFGRVDELSEQADHACWRVNSERPGTLCPGYFVVLKAHAGTDMRLIYTIVRTARAVGFDVLFDDEHAGVRSRCASGARCVEAAVAARRSLAARAIAPLTER